MVFMTLGGNRARRKNKQIHNYNWGLNNQFSATDISIYQKIIKDTENLNDTTIRMKLKHNTTQQQCPWIIHQYRQTTFYAMKQISTLLKELKSYR